MGKAEQMALFSFKIIKRKKINHDGHATEPKPPSTFKVRHSEDTKGSHVLLASY